MPFIIDDFMPDAIHSLPLSISLDYLETIEKQLMRFQIQSRYTDAPLAKPINWPLDMGELLSLYHYIKAWMQEKKYSEIHIGQLLPSLENTTPKKLHKHLVLFWSEYFRQMLQYEENPRNLSSFVGKEVESPLQVAGFIVYILQKYNFASIAKTGIFQQYFISQCFSLPTVQRMHQLIKEMLATGINLELKETRILRYFKSELKGFEKYRLTGDPFYYELLLLSDKDSPEDSLNKILQNTVILADFYVWDKHNITHVAVDGKRTSYPLNDVSRIDTFLHSCKKIKNSHNHEYVIMSYEDVKHCIHKNSAHAMPTVAKTLPYVEAQTLTLTPSLNNIENLYQLFGPAIIQAVIHTFEDSNEREEIEKDLSPFFEKMPIKELRDLFATSIRCYCRGITVLGQVLSLEKSKALFELCTQEPDIVSPWMILAVSSELKESETVSHLRAELDNAPLTPQCLVGLLSLKVQQKLSEIEESANIERIYHYLLENPKVYLDHAIKLDRGDDPDDDPYASCFFAFMSKDDSSISDVICRWLRTGPQTLSTSLKNMHALLQRLKSAVELSLPLTIDTFHNIINLYEQQKATVAFLLACELSSCGYPKDNYGLYNLIISLYSNYVDFDLSSCLDLFCPLTKFVGYPSPLMEQQCAQARVIFEYVLKGMLKNTQIAQQLCAQLGVLIFSEPACFGFDVIRQNRVRLFLAELLNFKTPEELLALIESCIQQSAYDTRYIAALHNIAMLLNQYKLEAIVQLKKTSVWRLIDYLGYRDLSLKMGKTRLKKLINLLKKELINNENYVHILNVMAKTTLFNVKEKEDMFRRIFLAYIRGYVSADIADEVVGKLVILIPWISSARSECYQIFMTQIEQAYPLSQVSLSNLILQFETYQTKLKRLANFSETVHVHTQETSLDNLIFLILYSHMNHRDFNLYQNLDILCGVMHCDRGTLLFRCMSSNYFRGISSHHYFKALLQKDENQETGLHLLLKTDPECALSLIERAETKHKMILLKQTNASGESIWAMCLRLYVDMPIFQCISVTLTIAQKRKLGLPREAPEIKPSNVGVFRFKRNRCQDTVVENELFERPVAKSQKR